MIKRIKLSNEGRAMVQMCMKPFDNLRLEKVQFKVDTGADLTTITKKELNVLGYTADWIKANTIKEEKRTISSAGGRNQHAYYVQIPISNLFGKDFKNWPFYIRIEDDRDFPNLLGLNVLTYFKFAFQYDIGYLEIEPLKDSIIKLPLKAEQEVNEPYIEYKSSTALRTRLGE